MNSIVTVIFAVCTLDPFAWPFTAGVLPAMRVDLNHTFKSSQILLFSFFRHNLSFSTDLLVTTGLSSNLSTDAILGTVGVFEGVEGADEGTEDVVLRVRDDDRDLYHYA